MNDLVTITIPSTGRKERLADCLMSIDYADSFVKIGASKNDDIPWHVLNDKFLNNSSFQYIYFDPVYIQNFLAGSIRPGSHLLPIADDIVFEPGAIKNAVFALNAAFPDGDGVVGFDVKNMDDDQKCPYAFMMIGNRFLSETLNGIPFFHKYRHFYADMELGELADCLGKFITCKDAGIIHFHPSAGYPKDETHMKARQEKWDHDNAVYVTRKKCLANGLARYVGSQRTIQTAA
jgi:hypothetical protein